MRGGHSEARDKLNMPGQYITQSYVFDMIVSLRIDQEGFNLKDPWCFLRTP